MLNFDAFEESEIGFVASCEERQWEGEAVIEVMNRYGINFQKSIIPKTNWNKTWEKNYESVKIGKQVYVRASFHDPDPTFEHQILITPKMSFGTGHHDTTSLMMKKQLEIDHKSKDVLDVGCGTGVLSILAYQLGAKKVKALDIDEWAVENSEENFSLNECEIEVLLGGIDLVKEFSIYDIVLANINKNVLLEQIPAYVDRMKPSGILLLSGFYESDIDDISALADQTGLQFSKSDVQNNWAVLAFKKP